MTRPAGYHLDYDDDDIDMPRHVSLEEQEQTGLARRTTRNTFVPATPHRADLPAHTGHSVMLDIQPSAQQIVEVRTSGVDRARGFQLAFIPLAAALGLLIVFVSLAFENEFFSLMSLVLFWCTFVLTWLIGWIATLLLSAEGVSFFEAHRKWNVVDREQRERWEHYRWQQGRDNE